MCHPDGSYVVSPLTLGPFAGFFKTDGVGTFGNLQVDAIDVDRVVPNAKAVPQWRFRRDGKQPAMPTVGGRQMRSRDSLFLGILAFVSQPPLVALLINRFRTCSAECAQKFRPTEDIHVEMWECAMHIPQSRYR
jgi:hypothetical protein